MSEKHLKTPEIFKPSLMKPITKASTAENINNNNNNAVNNNNDSNNNNNNNTSNSNNSVNNARTTDNTGNVESSTERKSSNEQAVNAVTAVSTTQQIEATNALNNNTNNNNNNVGNAANELDEKKILIDFLKSSATQINDNDRKKLFEMLKNERLRLLTFNLSDHKWPHRDIDPIELAKAGFFYLFNGDRVKCVFCNGELESWSSNDIPLLEHFRAYPRCPFMLDYNVGNVPINNGVNVVSNFLRHYGRDICGNHELPTLQINGSSSGYSSPTSGSTSPSSLSVASSLSASPTDVAMNPLKSKENLSDLGVRPHRVAKNPNFISYDARLKTFENKWSPKLKATPEKLAEAGFYHVGIQDYVKCCYCDGGLCEWSENDDPWVEHASWFPDCDFVTLNKGLAFIESCQERCQQRKLIHQSTTSSSDYDEKSINAVNEWFNSDLVKGLPKNSDYNEDTIKAALHKRWVEKQEPFAHLGELITAISEIRSIPKLLSINISDDEGIEANERKDSEASNSTTPMSASPTPPSSVKGEERLHCKICLDREVGVLFLPCGHVVACTQCAPGFENCPICRKQIKGIVRTFFS